MIKALGLIEVIGYIAAIEAADTAIKTADVELLGVEKVTGGIVTVKLTGDVGAVKAAVDVAKEAAASVGTLRAAHVIPRLHEEVSSMLEGTMQESITETAEEAIEEPAEEVIEETAEEVIEETAQEAIEEPVEKIAEEPVGQVTKDEERLAAMSVVEIKKLARSLALPITSKKIKTAKKEELIDILLKFYRGDGK